MFDVPINDLIEKVAENLKKLNEIKPPIWADFVKTGRHKERRPVRTDWWFTRTAAVMLSVARLGPVGVSKLRMKYGGKKNRGVASEHQYRGSGNIIRKALQQLEKAGLVKETQKGVHKGRVLTPKGISFIAKATKETGKK